MKKRTCSPESAARYEIEKAIFNIRQAMATYPDIAEIKDTIESVLGLMSRNAQTIGEDFCIEKGIQLKNLLKDHMEFDVPHIEITTHWRYRERAVIGRVEYLVRHGVGNDHIGSNLRATVSNV